jgi:hypothetical protein
MASVAALVLMSLQVPPAAAAQDGRQIAIQYNVWGAKSNTAYNTQIAQAVINSLRTRNPKPTVISFNEICWRQLDQIQREYLDVVGGYVAFAHWSIKTPLPNCDGTMYGNVIVGLNGGATVGTDHTYSGQEFVTEKRGAACLSRLAGNTTACSSHLSTNLSTAKNQMAQLRTLVNQWVTQGIPLYVLGDFNVETKEHLTTFQTSWYSTFAEGDRPGATVYTRRITWKSKVTTAQRSIDYVFRRVPKTFTAVAYLFFGPYSDHAWYEAYLT